jgi:GTPase SAR1 family protein
MTDVDTVPGLEKWISEFKKYTEEPLLFVVGNKTDLEDAQTVQKDEVERFAADQGAKCCFTSAKTGDGVKELGEAGKILCEDQRLKEAGGGKCC